jgi:Chaperone of endosialidase
VKLIKGSAIVGVGLIGGALSAIGNAYGAQPPDVVVSDASENTAMGSGSLFNLSPAQDCTPHTCFPNGNQNTAAGYHALFSNVTGKDNTAVGDGALSANTSDANTAVGQLSLAENTSGAANTAVGAGALQENTIGYDNTAAGQSALGGNSTGIDNTAFGTLALSNNGAGTENTAMGSFALAYPNGTTKNTAVGARAMQNNVSGSANTATGEQALTSLNNGSSNTATGVAALMNTTSGSSNSALGLSALQTNGTGSNNVAIGDHAGYFITGSNNIDIANHGVAGENNAIRIGAVGTQKTAFLAGVYGTPLTGAAVVVTSTGQLGVVVSSERFKTNIAPIGDTTSKLEQLRPVTFHLKSDPSGPLQYGLIAEEVAKVYPDLVIRDEHGRIDGVRYDELTPMLLNEMQQQSVQIRDLKQQAQIVQKQAAEIQQLKMQMTEMQELKRELQASVQQSRSHHLLVAAK